MTREQSIKLVRAAANPIIAPADVAPSYPDWEVLGVFNAGVHRHDGETVLLLRVAERPRQSDPAHVLIPVLNEEGTAADRQAQPMRIIALDREDESLDFSDPRVVRDSEGNTLYLTSISHLRAARSRDGLRFEVDASPTVLPAGRLEAWGIEDPRITRLEDRYYTTYSAVSEKGVAVGLLSSSDLNTYEREGLILAPTNKDVALFPEKIGGKYWMLHRPVPEGLGSPEMWVASSPDLIHWGDHRFQMGLRPGLWDSARIGAGCVPIKTDEGWLILYHGADDQHNYAMGAALVDLERPDRVLARMEQPLMVPEAEYETSGFFANVVFACGAVVDDDKIMMYYGASDDTMAAVQFSFRQVMEQLSQTRQKGLDGS
ncbi:glycoside hydrolase family 130 protein [Paenibacillus sp. 1P07SE]|uniref:glycoside hydrolase family 130 protein n=1 Tax=Paenibacillus sp. 1P07SE TaxID=3132209 RepID=UPI0039A60083